MSNSCLQDWWNHAWMLAAATAGTALPGLVALSSQGLTAGRVALSLVGSAGGVAAGVLTGRMGNVLHDRMKDGVADPRALLRNHHLHRLTAESAKSVLLASQSEMLSRSDKEHLPRLAAAVVSEWDELADTKGFQDAVLGLSRDDLKAWLGAGLGDEALSNPPRALTPDAWEIMLRAVGRKHGCTLSDRALTTVATRLHEQLPETVREMLKQGGPALNGMFCSCFSAIFTARFAERSMRSWTNWRPPPTSSAPSSESSSEPQLPFRNDLKASPTVHSSSPSSSSNRKNRRG
jgi:hypothetical protein